MANLKSILATREQTLLQLKKQKEKDLQSAPEGSLRINTRGNHSYYYLRSDPKDFNGSYIRQENQYLANQLAQKDYDIKVLHSINQELLAIKKYRSAYPASAAEDIYSTLHENRQALVTPIYEPDEQYLEQWNAVKYTGKPFDETIPPIYTTKGERVRSKSEMIIADLLYREQIPYRYEYPLNLREFGRVYPDFTLLHLKKREELYWEHFGMMDDPIYAEKAVQKITTYAQHGLFPGCNLILTFETRQVPLSQKYLLNLLQQFF